MGTELNFFFRLTGTAGVAWEALKAEEQLEWENNINQNTAEVKYVTQTQNSQSTYQYNNINLFRARQTYFESGDSSQTTRQIHKTWLPTFL